MAEETLEIANPEKKKGWFQKIPAHVLLSPAGIILAMFALVIETIDLIPLPIIDQLWELPLEIAFIIFFLLLVKDASFKSLIVPFVLERIPVLSDILPTWFLKIIM